jgi:hypothetical protein
MSRNYKNIIKLKRDVVGKERRENLAKEVLQDATPLPNPLEYEDIDKEFERWVSQDLDISFENQKLPTYLMLSNQRFSEYLQSWQHVDEKKNLILNFKTITRENNPKAGTIVGDTRNIPGDIDFLINRVFSVDKHGNRYFIDYRMKQPISIDLIYTVSIFTNKYQLLNEFNIMMNEKFKAIDCYIRPNGHFIPMKLNDISDESEYNIDDRRYYSQSYSITVMAYIIPKNSFRVIEQPMMRLECFDGEVLSRPKTIVEETECLDNYNPYEYQPIEIQTVFPSESTKHKFKIDCDSEITAISMSNTRFFDLYINGKLIDISRIFKNDEELCYDEYTVVLADYFSEEELEQFKFNDNDEIKFANISKYKTFENAKINLIGKDFTNVVEKTEAL